jgi:hypothetical protein
MDIIPPAPNQQKIASQRANINGGSLAESIKRVRDIIHN